MVLLQKQDGFEVNINTYQVTKLRLVPLLKDAYICKERVVNHTIKYKIFLLMRLAKFQVLTNLG